jgi:predicted transcriptional regulator
MLERLNAIDWAAEGFERIPYWIEKMQKGEVETKLYTIYELFNEMAPDQLWDGQGSFEDLLEMMRYKAHSYLVPFILELISFESSVKVQLDLLGLLAVFLGYCFQIDRVPEENREDYRQWAQSIYQGVKKGQELFDKLLSQEKLTGVRQLSTGIEELLEILGKLSKKQIFEEIGE